MNEHAPIWRRTRRAGLALVAGLILLPTAAQAASSTATSDGATTTITGSAGADTVDVSSYEGVLTLGGVDAGPGCTQEYPGVGTTVCPIGPGGVDVRTGEGDDRVFVYLDDRPAGYVRADLGGGDDYFEGRAGGDRAFGGPGNDELEGYGGADELDGGDGDDTVNGDDGADVVRGGPGNDFLKGGAGGDAIDGGAGIDKVDEWASADAYVPATATVTLDGIADDGLPGEGDNVVGIENVQSFSGLAFVGTDGPDGARASQVGGDGSFAGRGGDDVLVGGDRDDRIDGGAGADDLEGGYGNDTIVGGPGADRIAGDRGARCNEMACDLSPGSAADTIDARDGEPDIVGCGPGADTVQADSVDTVDTDCETVTRGGGPGAGPGTGPGAVPGALALPARASLRALLKRGWTITVRGRTAGAKVSVRVVKGAKLVARGSANAGRSGTARVRVRVTRAGRRALRNARGARLTVVAGAARRTVRVKR